MSPHRFRRSRSLLRPAPAAVALALAIATCAPLARAMVTVRDAWLRGTVAPQEVTSAYLTVQSDRPVTLIGATSPIAARLELHEMSMDQGVMRMRGVPTLPLAPNRAVELKPGGYHFMVMNLAHPLKDGEKVPLTLRFRDADGKESTVTVQAEVRPLTAPAPHPAGHAH